MKNTHISKFIAVFASIALTAGFAMPASADMTTSGYYDQFGVWHVYQTYSGPTTNTSNYSNYNTNSEYRTAPAKTLRSVTCSAGETYNAASNICLPPTSSKTADVAGDGYNITQKDVAKKESSSATHQASAVSSIFGRKKAPTELLITNIVVTSGPKNIYEDKSAVNCDVLVSWATSLPAAGQVVYGPVSQPNVETFNYPSTAPEGNSYKTAHEVKLGCLENVTYAMRIIQNSGGDDPKRVISDEQTIFPIKILTDIPLVSGGETSDAPVTNGGASAISTLGSIFASPILWIILLGAIAFVIVRAFLAKKSKGDDHGPAHSAEPALQIPHH